MSGAGRAARTARPAGRGRARESTSDHARPRSRSWCCPAVAARRSRPAAGTGDGTGVPRAAQRRACRAATSQCSLLIHSRIRMASVCRVTSHESRPLHASRITRAIASISSANPDSGDAELLPTGGRDGVVARTLVVRRLAPLGLDPPLLPHALERRDTASPPRCEARRRRGVRCAARSRSRASTARSAS